MKNSTTKSCFFEKINKINNPVARLTKKKEKINYQNQEWRRYHNHPQDIKTILNNSINNYEHKSDNLYEVVQLTIIQNPLAIKMHQDETDSPARK